MGIFSFLGGLLGAGSVKGASHKAETAQLDYLGRALTAEQQQQALARSDLSPWRTEGGAALMQQGDLTGLHGAGVQQSAIDALRGLPLFQSLMRNGTESVLQNASATGGVRGGNTERSLADFSADTLAQVIQQQLSNLGNISGQGLQAANSTVASGDQLTQAIASILSQQGQVRAGGLLTRGGITNGMWQNAGGFLDQGIQSILGGGGGGLASILKGF